jgi:ankyrin repeat protein
VVRQLLRGGVDPNARHGIMETTPLPAAVEAESAGVVRALLDGGADVNAADFGRTTAMSLAARHGCADLVRLLLDARADANRADDEGMTPLLWAVWWSRQAPDSPSTRR